MHKQQLQFNTLKNYSTLSILLLLSTISICIDSELFAQNTNNDTIIKGDTLQTTNIVSSQRGNYLSKGKQIRTEVISTAGLHKMACCNLAESFENSSSVTVGYSDAVTGARQIRLLGLSGTYTQFLDEKRPILRGFTLPWGLTFIPGSWMESIQIAKGSSSVIEGVESITGEINIEHKKPTDQKILFVNGSYMSDTQTDLNILSSIQLNPSLFTNVMAHFNTNFYTHDGNHDGFIDDPRNSQMNFANRWIYFKDKIKLHFGFKAFTDKRKGGQKGYEKDKFKIESDLPWGTYISNEGFNAYLKAGLFTNEDQTSSIAIISDFTYHKLKTQFGESNYDGKSNSGFINLLYRTEISHHHDLTIGLSGNIDRYNQDYNRKWVNNTILEERILHDSFINHSTLSNGGIYAEYTFKSHDDIFTAIAGIRGEWYNKGSFEFIPRLSLRFKPSEYVVIRANGGRGIRNAIPIVENIGVMSTNKTIGGIINLLPKEEAFTYGGNITFYLPIDSHESTYISFDYFRTNFQKELIVDYDYRPNQISFYLSNKNSYTQNFQVDFNSEPFERFNVAATFRWTQAKRDSKGDDGLYHRINRPMISKYKGVLNLQYKTNMGKWVFDFTMAINGPAKVYEFMKNLTKPDGTLIYSKGKTPIYPIFYGQITRHFKGFDIYIGCENIGSYKQKYPIIGERNSHGVINPKSNNFDASAIWGPLMGRRFDIGFRLTIWDKNN